MGSVLVMDGDPEHRGRDLGSGPVVQPNDEQIPTAAGLSRGSVGSVIGDIDGAGVEDTPAPPALTHLREEAGLRHAPRVWPLDGQIPRAGQSGRARPHVAPNSTSPSRSFDEPG